jgi:hypothetical protein
MDGSLRIFCGIQFFVLIVRQTIVKNGVHAMIATVLQLVPKPLQA